MLIGRKVIPCLREAAWGGAFEEAKTDGINASKVRLGKEKQCMALEA